MLSKDTKGVSMAIKKYKGFAALKKRYECQKGVKKGRSLFLKDRERLIHTIS